jgi:hypothetical protein
MRQLWAFAVPRDTGGLGAPGSTLPVWRPTRDLTHNSGQIAPHEGAGGEAWTHSGGRPAWMIGNPPAVSPAQLHAKKCRSGPPLSPLYPSCLVHAQRALASCGFGRATRHGDPPVGGSEHDGGRQLRPAGWGSGASAAGYAKGGPGRTLLELASILERSL